MTENGGLKGALFKFIAVLSIVLVLTIVSMLPLDLYPEVSANIRGVALLVVFPIFLIGIVSAAYAKRPHVLKYALPLGLLVPSALMLASGVAIALNSMGPVVGGLVSAGIVAGGLVLLALLPSNRTETVSSNPLTTTTSLKTAGGSMRSLFRRSERLLAGVEVLQIPAKYVAGRDVREEGVARTHLFHRVIRAARMSGIPLVFRMENEGGRSRLLYLTYAEDEAILRDQTLRLERTLSSILTGFTLKTHERFRTPPTHTGAVAATAYLEGALARVTIGEEVADGLTIATEYLGGLKDAAITVITEPARPSGRHLSGLKRAFRETSGRASKTVSQSNPCFFSQDAQESITIADFDATAEARDLAAEIRRYEATDVCRASISVTCRGTSGHNAEQHAVDVLGAIVGSVRPSSERRGLSITAREREDVLERLAEGRDPRNWTVMTPDEIVPVTVIPPIDLGLEVVTRARFTTGKTTQSKSDSAQQPGSHETGVRLSLGWELDESGTKVGPVHLSLDDLTRHLEILGDTGSGKTTTVKRILRSVHDAGIPFLVLTPTLTHDYVSLADEIPELRFFTPGDEQTAPLRFNPHQFSEGVLVNTILADVKAAYIASAPSIGIVKEYTEMCINNAFERCRYDGSKNRHGHPVLLSDLLDSIMFLEHKMLTYSDGQNQDMRGALRGRFLSLMEGPLHRVFNTLVGMTVEELVSAPTVIALDGLSADERALFAALIVVNLARHFESRSLQSPGRRGLRFSLVLEEAHHFLVRTTQASVTEEHAAKTHAIRSIVETLRESRRNGLGVVILDQLPSSLDEHAMSLPVTTILHRLSTGIDRRAIGMKLDLTEEQLRMVGSLPVGHAVAKFASSDQPMYMWVHPPAEDTPAAWESRLSLPARVREQMQPVYEENPHVGGGPISDFTLLDSSESPTGEPVTLDLRVGWDALNLVRCKTFHQIREALINKISERDVPIALGVLWNSLLDLIGRPPSIGVVCLFTQLLRPPDIGPAAMPRYLAVVEEVWRLYGEQDLSLNNGALAEMTPAVLEAIEGYGRHLKNRVQTPDGDVVYAHFCVARDHLSAQEEPIKEEDGEPEESATQGEEFLLDPDTEQFFLAAIGAHDFSSMYYESLRRAVDGDLTKITRMLFRFVERFGPDGCDRARVAEWLFERASEILDAPPRGTMQKSIRKAIRGAA
jgi:hypothetical protein